MNYLQNHLRQKHYKPCFVYKRENYFGSGYTVETKLNTELDCSTKLVSSFFNCITRSSYIIVQSSLCKPYDTVGAGVTIAAPFFAR